MATLDFTDPLIIQAHLASTFIPLSTLTPLSGGFSNFTFRANLSTSSPLVDNAITVIIKHSEPFSALHRDISLDPLRSVRDPSLLLYPADVLAQHYEHVVLTACPPTVTLEGMRVETPSAYHCDLDRCIIVLSDAGEKSVDLKTLLLSPSSSYLHATLIGQGLGCFLRSVHTWGGSPDLRNVLEGHTIAGLLWTWLNYGRLLETIDRFPSVLLSYKETFVEVVSAPEIEESEKTLVHGDFWCANVLVSPEQNVVTVIDWEMSRFGHVWQDLGQMCAELFLPYQFHAKMEGLFVIEGLLKGYGGVSEEVARRVVVHIGVHLVVWPCRVGTWGGKEEMAKCVEVGAEFIERGWKKDWKWIKESELGTIVKEEWIKK